MTNSTQTSLAVAQDHIDMFQRRLKLSHWTIVVSKTPPSPGNYMEIAITRSRNYAAVRISDQAWKESYSRSFITGIKHELIHIIMDPILDEYEKQHERNLDVLKPGMHQEYYERYNQVFEKVVDTLAHVV